MHKILESFPVVSTDSNYSYLFSLTGPYVLLITPQLKRLFYSKLDSSVEPLLSFNVKKGERVRLYSTHKRYFDFLKDQSFFEVPMKRSFPENFCTEDIVRTSLANTDLILYETTSFCPMDCFYCCYGELYQNQKHRKIQNLPVETAKKLLDFVLDLKHSRLNRKNFRKFSMGFYGGEPLSNFDFIAEMVSYAKSKNWEYNEIEFNITTNGVLLDRYMDFLVKNNFNLTISLDGNEQNNEYRVFKDGSPTFPVVMRNILKLKNKYPEYFEKRAFFNAIIHSKNLVYEVQDFFDSFIGKSPLLSEVSLIGTNPEKESILKSIYRKISESQKSKDSSTNEDTQIRILLDLFLRSYTSYKITKYSHLLEDAPIVFQTKTGTCLPFMSKIFCTSDGKLLPCERIPLYYSLGSVDENGVYIDYQSVADKYNCWYDKIRSRCNQCYDSTQCGKCIFYIDLLSENPSCSNFKNETEFLEELKKKLTFFESKPSAYLSVLKKKDFQSSEESVKSVREKNSGLYSHWLFLHPYTVLNVKSERAVIYNTLNGKLLEYKGNKNVLNMLKKLSVDENLYVIGLKLTYPPEVKRLIRDIRATFSGDLIVNEIGKPKPFQFKPIFSLNYTSADFSFPSRVKLLDEDQITDHLESINLYINSSCSRDCSFCSTAYKQFLCCTSHRKNTNEISLDSVKNLLFELQRTITKQINILGGNIFDHSEFESMIDLLNGTRYAINYYIHFSNFSEGDYLKYIERFKRSKRNALHLLIPASIDRTSVIRLVNSLKGKSLNVYFHFIVEKKVDFSQIPSDEYLGIKNHSIVVPFYNGRNLGFFKKYLFVTKSALSESCPSLKDTFARAILNSNEFAKLTVMSDLQVYANVNNPSLGKLGKTSLIEIIKKEMTLGRSWGKIRKQVKPCNGCPYNTICPPITGYEYAIGRYNLCHLYENDKSL